MARPALSASRGIEVIDLLAAFPERGFTLSEIARATKINIASCHAVVTALVERGYLARSTTGRAYTLGPLLTAIGQAAQKAQPMISRATDAAHDLSRELNVSVSLTTVVGQEIVALVSLEVGGRAPGIKVAERRPLVAPLGAPFVAWSSEEVVEAWIARNTLPQSQDRSAEWRHILELTRQRGYTVTLRSPNSRGILAMRAELASGNRFPDYKEELFSLFTSLDHDLDQPETIEPDQLYDILLIGSPLFDRKGEVVLSLNLGDFAEKLSGATITAYADRLVRVCLDVMRAERGRE
jgi:DNA-binding IclR family transcriptional regulator